LLRLTSASDEAKKTQGERATVSAIHSSLQPSHINEQWYLGKVITVIKNETAGVDETGPEVLDVEVECLHDARREKNRGARCSRPAW
jgi:hypothetical protein